MIYKHATAWWDDDVRGNLPILPPELSGNPANIVICSKPEEREKKENFGLRSIFIHTCK
jgi:hypothetical protein